MLSREYSFPHMEYEFLHPQDGEKKIDSQEWLMNSTIKSASRVKKIKSK